MNTSLRIKPFAIQSAELATIENISVNVELGKATVSVALRSAQGDNLKTVFADISGEDYDNWKADDKYIVIKAMNQLGIEIIGEAGSEIKTAQIIEAPQPEVISDEVIKENSDEVAKENSDEATKESSDESADINEPADGKQKVKKRN